MREWLRQRVDVFHLTVTQRQIDAAAVWLAKKDEVLQALAEAAIGIIGGRTRARAAPATRASPRQAPTPEPPAKMWYEDGEAAGPPPATGPKTGRQINPAQLVRPAGMGNPAFGELIGWTDGPDTATNLDLTRVMRTQLPHRLMRSVQLMQAIADRL